MYILYCLDPCHTSPSMRHDACKLMQKVITMYDLERADRLMTM